MQTRTVDHRDPPAMTPEQWHAAERRRLAAVDPGVVKANGRSWKRNKAIVDTKTGRQWRSLTECSRSLGLSLSGVSSAIARGVPTKSGRLLEYVTE